MVGVDSFFRIDCAHGESVLVDCHWGWFGVMGWAGIIPGLNFDPMLQEGQIINVQKCILFIAYFTTDKCELMNIFMAGNT